MAYVDFDSSAPTGFLIVSGDDDVLIQSDWDYPGVASNMGWTGDATDPDQIEDAYDWITAHEGEDFDALDDYF